MTAPYSPERIFNAAGIVFLLAVGFLVGFCAAVLMGVF